MMRHTVEILIKILTKTLFNEDGEPTEVLTPEELENQTAALITAKEQEYEKDNKHF